MAVFSLSSTFNFRLDFSTIIIHSYGMARILTFSRHQVPKENILDKIRHLWEIFSSQDKFTKASIITAILFAIGGLAFLGEKTGFFIHASNSVYSTCIQPPAGFDQQELKMISQTRHVNWCKTLAANETAAQNGSPDNAPTSHMPGPATDPISILGNQLQQFIASIIRLFSGR